MSTWIKAGFWEELCKPCQGYKGWLNLTEFVKSIAQLYPGPQGPQGPPGPGIGLYAQTAASEPITNTTDELSLVNGGVGTMTVPANGFSVGDSFKVDMSGTISALNNQVIRIRVKSGSMVLLDSGLQTLSSGVSNDVWTLTLDFTIRQVGAAGVAELVSFGRFGYSKTTNSSLQGFAMSTINNTTFDTTVSNTLDITFEWATASDQNIIYTDVFVLNKIY